MTKKYHDFLRLGQCISSYSEFSLKGRSSRGFLLRTTTGADECTVASGDLFQPNLQPLSANHLFVRLSASPVEENVLNVDRHNAMAGELKIVY
jgi:hypothetical protein